MPLLALVWLAFTIFMATVTWRATKKYGQPQLGFSSYDNDREALHARFFRKLGLTACGLLLLSGLLGFSSAFLAALAIIAIPVVGALQIVRRKKSIESSGNRSLPLR